MEATRRGRDRQRLSVGTTASHLTPSPPAPDTRWPTDVYLDSHRAAAIDEGTDSIASRVVYVAKPNQIERVRVNG